MKNKYTPGPWAAHALPITNTFEVKAPNANMGERHVCCTDSLNVSDETKIANARLIAAAPELLDALEELYSITYGKHKDNDQVSEEYIVNLVQTVIAKARGEL